MKARKEAEGKASRLEVKVACFEADVAKDAVDDVAALAHAYMEADDSLDLEDAIEKVVKKYPSVQKRRGRSLRGRIRTREGLGGAYEGRIREKAFRRRGSVPEEESRPED